MLSAISRIQGFVVIGEDAEQVRPGDLAEFVPHDALVA